MVNEYEKRRAEFFKWASSLQVGDEVALVNSNYGGKPTYRFGKVAKITKQHGGTLFVGRESFDFYGNIRGRSGSGYNRTELAQVTQEIRDEDEANWIRSDLRSYFYERGEEGLSLTALRLIQTVVAQYPLKKTR
jgi:hypothetical protein